MVWPRRMRQVSPALRALALAVGSGWRVQLIFLVLVIASSGRLSGTIIVVQGNKDSSEVQDFETMVFYLSWFGQERVGVKSYCSYRTRVVWFWDCWCRVCHGI